MPVPTRLRPLKPGLKEPANGLPAKLLRLFPKEVPARPPKTAPMAAPSVRFPEPAISDPSTPPRPAPAAPPNNVLLSNPPNSWACAVAGINAMAATAAVVIRNFIVGSSRCRKIWSTTPHKWCCLPFAMQASRRFRVSYHIKTSRTKALACYGNSFSSKS